MNIVIPTTKFIIPHLIILFEYWRISEAFVHTGIGQGIKSAGPAYKYMDDGYTGRARNNGYAVKDWNISSRTKHKDLHIHSLAERGNSKGKVEIQKDHNKGYRINTVDELEPEYMPVMEGKYKDMRFNAKKLGLPKKSNVLAREDDILKSSKAPHKTGPKHAKKNHSKLERMTSEIQSRGRRINARISHRMKSFGYVNMQNRPHGRSGHGHHNASPEKPVTWFRYGNHQRIRNHPRNRKYSKAHRGSWKSHIQFAKHREISSNALPKLDKKERKTLQRKYVSNIVPRF